MTENKQKLIALVSALESEGSIDYFYTFIALRLYGTVDCPSSKFVEVCEMYEKHMKPRIEKQEQERQEQIAEEKKAEEYRCNIVRTVYNIKSLAILNYIDVIVSDIAKEPESEVKVAVERMATIAELLKEIEGIDNIAKIRFLLGGVRSYNGKGGVKAWE